MRLDRLLSSLALGSRSQVQRLIRQGDVSVNGDTARDPGMAVGERDAVRLRGEPLDTRLERHVMLYKPAGVLTAARDRRQPTVMDLLPPVYASLGCMPVGRLDKDTTGLLLFTTDGELQHRLLSPSRGVEKVYRMTVDGPLGGVEIAAFAAGLHTADFDALPARLEVLRSAADGAEALVTVREGQFHQIKRMAEAVGRQVRMLHRCSFGPLPLDESLSPGEWRELTADETALLRQAAGMEGA